MESLPIGNGNFGAMIFGQPTSETIRLNHDELWSGHPKEISNPDSSNHFDAVTQ